MGHDHNHSHGTENVSDGVLLWTVIVNLGLSVFEFVAGAISGSVALMADALHNTNDAAALLIAYIARKISRKGADEQYTYYQDLDEILLLCDPALPFCFCLLVQVEEFYQTHTYGHLSMVLHWRYL